MSCLRINWSLSIAHTWIGPGKSGIGFYHPFLLKFVLPKFGTASLVRTEMEYKTNERLLDSVVEARKVNRILKVYTRICLKLTFLVNLKFSIIFQEGRDELLLSSLMKTEISIWRGRLRHPQHLQHSSDLGLRDDNLITSCASSGSDALVIKKDRSKSAVLESLMSFMKLGEEDKLTIAELSEEFYI